jgi:hypothetical protein
MAAVGRRHAILVVVTIGLGLLFVPASTFFGRVPELLFPAFVLYGMLFLVAFRLTTGRSLAAEALAAAGLRPRRRRRGRRAVAAHVVWMLFLALSTLLAATAAALWLRSHGAEDKVVWTRWDVLGVTPSRWVRRLRDSISVTSRHGALAYDRRREIILDPQYVMDKQLQVLPKPWSKLNWVEGPVAAPTGIIRPSIRPMPTGSRLLDALGMEYEHGRMPQRFPGDPVEGVDWLVVPYWPICLACALPPVSAAVVFLLRLRPRKPGHCINCGYDLRATPGRCPECGEEARKDSSELPVRAPIPSVDA